MKNTFLASCAFGLLLAATTANATLVQSTTSAYMTFRDCLSDPTATPPTACDTVLGSAATDVGGDPGDLTASASLSNASYGTASGTVALSGVGGAPVFSASATSLAGTVADPGTRNGANLGALQRYTYTGAAATTRTFSFSVDFSQTIPSSNAGFPPALQGGTFTDLVLFTLTDAFLDAGSTAFDNFLTVIAGGFASAPGYTPLGVDGTANRLSNAAGIAANSVMVNLNPGDSVWVGARVQAFAADGAQINVTTRQSGWDDLTDLSPANSIPEPATLLLFGLGLAGFGLGKQRRRA